MKKILISSIVGIVILLVLFMNFNIHDLSQRIVMASPILVLLSFAIFLSFNILKSIRWKIIIRHGRFLNLFSIVQIGNLSTVILPSQLQEPIRALLLKEKEKIKFGYGISSIFLERIIDVMSLLFIALTVSLFFPITEDAQSVILHLIRDILIVVILVTTFFILLVIKPHLFTKLFSFFKKYHRLTKLYEKSESFILELSDGFKEIAKPTILVKSFFITVFMWMINFLTVYILFLSLDLQINPLIVLFGFVGVALGMILPQSPGYVGTFEAIWLGIFSILGYGNNNDILSVGILYHLLLLANNVLLGLVGMVMIKLSFKELFGNKIN